MDINFFYEEAINDLEIEEDLLSYLGSYSDFEEWLIEMTADEDQSLNF